MNLPQGQKARSDFPRFGLPRFADRFPKKPNDKRILVSVNGGETSTVDFDQPDLPRVSNTSDFHCVTTWSFTGLQWSGISFRDFYKKKIEGQLSGTRSQAASCIFVGQDGYRTSLLLTDLLQDGVMLADSLDGEPLSVAHGAPMRLVAPAHYGYKNLKHLRRIEFHETLPTIKRGISAFLDHPRARVAHEERGRWIPGWILRFLYRPLIGRTVRDFQRAMARNSQTLRNSSR